MTAREIRAVLVKPGDVLLIGNARCAATAEDVKAIADAFETLRQRIGLEVVAFAGDIDIDVWKSQASKAEPATRCFTTPGVHADDCERRSS